MPISYTVFHTQYMVYFVTVLYGTVWYAPWVPGSWIKPLKEPVQMSQILPTGHPSYPLTYDHRWPWCHNPRLPIGWKPRLGGTNLLWSYKRIISARCPVGRNWLTQNWLLKASSGSQGAKCFYKCLSNGRKQDKAKCPKCRREHIFEIDHIFSDIWDYLGYLYSSAL